MFTGFASFSLVLISLRTAVNHRDMTVYNGTCLCDARALNRAWGDPEGRENGMQAQYFLRANDVAL